MRVLFFLFCVQLAFAQDVSHDIHGRIITMEDGVASGLPYASLQWIDGVGFTADSLGDFSVKRSANSHLVVSYVGYATDTIKYEHQDPWIITLEVDNLLSEATVSHRQRGTSISTTNSIKTELLSVKELRKAACCNLSESFETNPSVDVSFSDAVTGNKEIKMLGLAGRYSLVTREGMPVFRGYGSLYGMSYIPGSWVNGIQISKGAGTVVNGYESMSGQINIELLKPEKKPPALVNFYANQGGRVEANLHLQQKISESTTTLLLVHGSMRKLNNDRNKDLFLDMPLAEQINVLNRWKYASGDWRVQVGAQYVNDKKNAGQFENKNQGYQVALNTQKTDVWTKIGYLFPNNVNQTIGLQVAGLVFDQHGHYGVNKQKAFQKSIYGNLIFESILGNTMHKYKLGLSVVHDDIEESLDTLFYHQKRTIPGAFAEYNWTPTTNFSIIAGLRNDWLGNQAVFLPRIHLRYELTEKTIARLSAGKGMRHGLLLGDRAGLAATSRKWLVDFEGLKQPEVAWNYGLNLTQNFNLDYREGYVSFDFYRTDFIQKMVTDVETFGVAAIYPLSGKSFSNSFQIEMTYEVIKRLDAKIAYRYFDIKTDFKEKGLLLNPLSANHRGFLNLGYETKKRKKAPRWSVDLTTQWIGTKRIPDAIGLVKEELTAPSYFQFHGQVTAKIGKRFQVYIGGENLANYRQEDPIIGAENPFGKNFDSSLIWGPIFGRSFYLGMRY